MRRKAPSTTAGGGTGGDALQSLKSDGNTPAPNDKHHNQKSKRKGQGQGGGGNSATSCTAKEAMAEPSSSSSSSSSQNVEVMKDNSKGRSDHNSNDTIDMEATTFPALEKFKSLAKEAEKGLLEEVEELLKQQRPPRHPVSSGWLCLLRLVQATPK